MLLETGREEYEINSSLDLSQRHSKGVLKIGRGFVALLHKWEPVRAVLLSPGLTVDAF